MTREELIKSIIQGIQLSTMDDKEKSMWMVLAPLMEEGELQKLESALKKEVNGLTDLYLEHAAT